MTLGQNSRVIFSYRFAVYLTSSSLHFKIYVIARKSTRHEIVLGKRSYQTRSFVKVLENHVEKLKGFNLGSCFSSNQRKAFIRSHAAILLTCHQRNVIWNNQAKRHQFLWIQKIIIHFSIPLKLSLKPLSGFRSGFRKDSGFDWFLGSLTRSLPAAVNYVIFIKKLHFWYSKSRKKKTFHSS